jgi:hypothetical protein
VFERLQRKPEGRHVLELDGEDLRRTAFETRKATLASLLRRRGLKSRLANGLQNLFAHNVGIALTDFDMLDDLHGEGSFDIVVAVSDPQCDAHKLEGDTENAFGLWVEPLAVKVRGDRHWWRSSLTGGSATGLSGIEAWAQGRCR